MNARFSIALVAVTAWLGTEACGGSESENGGNESDCASYSPQAPADQIAKSPRPNEAAELLVLETENTFVALDPLYERLATELSAIYSMQPSVSSIVPLVGAYRDEPLSVYFDDAGWPSVASHSYDAWKCANLAYGAVIELHTQSKSADLSFQGKRFNSALLEHEYSAFPHVEKATVFTYWRDGPDVCLEIRGDQHFYIFDAASGDCPAGCMDHLYYGFQVAPGAPPVALGTYDPKVMPTPSWYDDLGKCRFQF